MPEMPEDNMNLNGSNRNTVAKIPLSRILYDMVANLESLGKIYCCFWTMAAITACVITIGLSTYYIVDRVKPSQQCFNNEVVTEHSVIIYSSCDGENKVINK